jgi:hypothetical protein
MKPAEKPIAPPRISELVSNELWPGLTRLRPEDLADADFVIKEVRFMQGEYGEFVVARCSYPGKDEEFTTALSGVVVVRKLHDLEADQKWPVTAKRVMVGNHWDLV